MAVKNHFDGKSFLLWDEDIRTRRPEAMKAYRESCREEILFYEFLQYEFQEQWAKLKHYANGRGIRIIGDIPIYVAMDSADSWAHPELFQFDEAGQPEAVAGCPPDAFFRDRPAVGEIRFTGGSIIRQRITHGGCPAWSTASVCMMLCV